MVACLASGLLFVLIVAGAPPLASQTLLFEVASIKPSPPRTAGALVFVGDSDLGIVRTLGAGSSVEMTYGTILALIRFAYPTISTEIQGAPDWIKSERFDVRAKASAATPPLEQEEMVRALLADRFGLVPATR